MGIEIERKYLVDLCKIGPLEDGVSIRQGYIKTVDHTTVRIRLKGDEAFLTIKGENKLATRAEYEYPIPRDDAVEILENLCAGPVIDKTRYLRKFSSHLWEIDVFHGENAGLVVAEVELSSESETVVLPDWVTREVTGEAKYYNSSLLTEPFCCW